MIYNMTTVNDRVWDVKFTSQQHDRYYGNNSKTVIATTVEEAIAKVKDKYTDAIFVSINHKGSVDL